MKKSLRKELDYIREVNDLKHKYNKMLIKSNDRRYSELAVEREKNRLAVDNEKNKALAIKEDAVKTALSLASSDLRAAIDDLKVTIKPLVEYVSSQQGRGTGLSNWYGYIILAGTLIVALIALFR